VQTCVLLGFEVTSFEMVAFAVFGLLMGAVGYFVAKSGRPANNDASGFPFPPPHTGIRELAGPGSEQRQHPRFETQPFRLRMTLNIGGSEIEGLVLNQSLGGLCICVPQSLPEGAVLNLRGTDSSRDRINSQVIIKHCRPHRGGWALGCQYL
jgi:hypothetical protein